MVAHGSSLKMNMTNQLYPAVSKEEAIPQSLAACSLNAWGKRWSIPCGKGSTHFAGEPISLSNDLQKDTEKFTNEEHDESIIGEFQLPSDYQ